MKATKWFIGISAFLLICLVLLAWHSLTLESEPRVVSDKLSKLQISLERDIAGVNSKLDNISSWLGSLATEVSQSTINVAKLYSEVKNNVISVKADQASGSGFIWYGNVILTNYHVVKNARYVDVTFSDGTVKRVGVWAYDPYSDLAVLTFGDAYSTSPLTFADSNKIRIGEPAIAIGNPLGLASTVTCGIVSQVNRLLPSEGGYPISNILQIDVPISPGNSGGPLLNSRGEVIGITTAYIPPEKGAVSIGFAISSNMVKRVAEALIKTKKYEHPYLGIRTTDLTPLIAQDLGLDFARGVVILEVKPNTPAELAGLRNAKVEYSWLTRQYTFLDADIIVAIDGKVAKDTSELLSYLSEYKRPGENVTLKIMRKKATIDITFALGVRP